MAAENGEQQYEGKQQKVEQGNQTVKQSSVTTRFFNLGEGVMQTVRWHMKQRLKRCGFMEQMVRIDDATMMHCHVPKAWACSPKRGSSASLTKSMPSLHILKGSKKWASKNSNLPFISPSPRSVNGSVPSPVGIDHPPRWEKYENGGPMKAPDVAGVRDVRRDNGVGGRFRKPVLLLLHAFGPEAMFHWDKQVGALSQRFDVVMPDLVFFGKSTSSSKDRSEVFQARWVAKLMECYKVTKYDVMGISYGGFVTYRLAQLYPDNVRKVVLTGCPGPIVTRPDYNKILEGLEVDDWLELLVPESTDAMRKGMAVTYHRPPSIPDFVLYGAMKVLFRTQVAEKRECVKALLANLDNPEVPTPKIHQETLLVWGEYDRAFPLYLGQRLADFLGESARLEVMKDAAHQPSVEKPKMFNGLILDFLFGDDANQSTTKVTESND